MIRARNPGIRLLALVVSLAVLAFGVWRSRAPTESPLPGLPRSSPVFPGLPRFTTDPAILDAIQDQRSNVWGQAAGVVTRLLKDDREGSAHQRFLIRLPTGTTLLVAYNLDLAPRIAPLEVGDTVALRGEYEWNDKGGVMHWVHRDPSGRMEGGWVKVRGKEYR